MRPIRVVIADGGLVPRTCLVPLTERAGFDLVGEAVEWDDVVEVAGSRAADLILVSGSPDHASGIARLDGRLPSIVISPDAAATKEYTECGAFAVLTTTAEPEVLAATAAVAVARARDLALARTEVESLRGQLETRKLVERAKGVLMRRLDLTEDQAYRKMQRASQDENRKMREIAESILSAERLYSSEEPAPGDAL